MENNKTIWILSHYASLIESRPLELSRVFVKHGYRCVVVCSSFHHGQRRYLFDEEVHTEEKSPGVTFVYLHSGPAYTGNGAKRVLNFFDFNRLTRKHAAYLETIAGKPAYIIGSSLHPLVWEVCARFARRYRAKWVAEVRDLWPLQLIEMMNLPKYHPVVLFFGAVEKRAYRRADAVVTTMPYANEYICGELGFPKEKVHWIANGIDTAQIDRNLSDPQFAPADDLREYLEGHWCGVFCGSLVKAECVPLIIEAFSKADVKDARLAVIGSGHCEDEIREAVAASGAADRIRMFGRIPYETIPSVLSRAAFCIAAHEDSRLYRYGLSMLKLTDYLYSGKPTIFACSARSVVQEAGGFAVPSGDTAAMAAAIEQIRALSAGELEQIADREKAVIREHYDYANLGEEYLRIMEGLS